MLRLHLDDGRTALGFSLLDAGLVREMRTPAVSVPDPSFADAWGLGWALHGSGSDAGWFGHDGDDEGWTARARASADRGFAIVMLASCLPADGEWRRLLDALRPLGLDVGEPTVPWPPPHAAPIDPDVAGRYENGLMRLAVVERDGEFWLVGAGSGCRCGRSATTAASGCPPTAARRRSWSPSSGTATGACSTSTTSAGSPAGSRPRPMRLVQTLVEERARQRPEAEAVVCGEARLTYARLHRRANQLAHHLRDLRVTTEDRVGVRLDRSPDLAVALLGVLAAGAAYLPLDTEWPEQRVDAVLHDSGARAVVTADTLAGLDRYPDHDPEPWASPQSLAYVIYTSGSTGAPKGVMVEHRSLADDVAAVRHRFGLSERDRVLQFAPASFDPSLEQLLAALCSGATVVMRGPRPWAGPELAERLRHHRVTVANLTSSCTGSPPSSGPRSRTLS
jgi:hypothetical protein